jgi:5-(carboxyamino)imidazole ribonucleotide synthase
MNATWGILGDGQLAQMLALAGQAMGINAKLLSADPFSPAALVTPHIVNGSLKSASDLKRFFESVDGAIIESEFVSCDLIEQAGGASKVFPSLSALRILQNKFSQKRLLRRLDLPTSPFCDPVDLKERQSFLESHLNKQSRSPLVLKFATQGYDGKGVFVETAGSDFLAGAMTFCTKAAERGIDVYAEDKVKFKEELAMIAVRSINGEWQHYPLVLSHQENGVCNLVHGPATSHGYSAELEQEAAAIMRTVAEDLNLVGCFAIEFFVTHDQKLLVNEIAPRVHNSGHYTQDAAATSQFENHWRAVIGSPLGQTSTWPFFAMQNLLAPHINNENSTAEPPQNPGKDMHLHWYGKKGITPGRKLGHVNSMSLNEMEGARILKELKSTAASWVSTLKIKDQS